jgi:hypothetical protein
MSKMSAKNRLSSLILMVTALLSMVGCDVINDDEGVCTTTYQVRFRYDMNLKYANAFTHEVKSVRLFVLDNDGNIVWENRESGDALASDDYAMTVDVAPGTYQLVAWCSTNSNSSYSYFDTPRNQNITTQALTGLDNLGCVINGSTSQVNGESVTNVDYELDDLYHGMMTEVTFPDEVGVHTVTMPLVKDTNRFRIALQQVSGAPLDVDDFTFAISADNARLHYDNSVIKGHRVAYSPWHTSSATSAGEDTTEEDNVINVAVAELTVSRLMADDNPRLTVTNNESGETVFSIPLIDYAMMVKGYENREMSNQEYLDRQDEYNMTFFLDDAGRWIDSYIYINSWKVILQHESIK